MGFDNFYLQSNNVKSKFNFRSRNKQRVKEGENDFVTCAPIFKINIHDITNILLFAKLYRTCLSIHPYTLVHTYIIHIRVLYYIFVKIAPNVINSPNNSYNKPLLHL